MIPYIALILTISGVILGASAIVLSKFGESPSISKCFNASYVYNTTTLACEAANASGGFVTAGYGRNFSNEFYPIEESQKSIRTVAEQQSTVAIIAVMVIIISIIAGVFVYMKYFA